MSEKPTVSSELLSDDAILGGRVALRQPRKGFRVAIDSIFLPAAVPARAGDRILELGTGVGAAALCLARRVSGCRVTGIELDSHLVELAHANIVRNGLSESVEVLVGDVSDPPERITQKNFFHVMMNPPYLEERRSGVSLSSARVTATVEGETTLADWIELGLRCLRPKGSLTLIHRADRLADILSILTASRHRAGEIVVFPLWPETRRNPAIRVIVRARKGIATPLRLAPGLVLHRSDGTFTRDAEAVLRRARALDL
jgi:tRNA1(Val) A37 N6-methylase TrmN6